MDRRDQDEIHELESLPSQETDFHYDGGDISYSSSRRLFPEIDWHSGDKTDHDHYGTHIDLDDVVVGDAQVPEANSRAVLDDAASSVCIDDDIDLDVNKVVDMLSRKPRNGGALSDFDEYNQRVAREFVLREKAERRLRRVRETRQYGNYFGTPYPTMTGGTYTPSHNFDNFNGKRQNARYNHQLNVLNSPYTYEEQQRRQHRRTQRALSFDRGGAAMEDDLEAAAGDSMSCITMDLDELESDDASVLSPRGLVDHSGGTGNENKLRRAIQLRHIEVFALSGALGIGFFLNSSQAFAMAGPLGTLLGYLIAGFVVFAVMLCQGEMMSLLPSEDGIAGCVARFVDESLGFAVGACYWLSCAISVPADVTAAAMMLSSFPMLDSPDNSVLVWVTFFLAIVLLMNLVEVGMFMRLQALVSLITMATLVLLMICMWAANDGSIGSYHHQIGFRYWDTSKSNDTIGLFFGPFRPEFALETEIQHSLVFITKGIGGSLGRFLQVWYAISNALYAFLGTEIVFTTVAEVRTPRRSLPSAAQKTFYRIFIFYVLSILSVGLNLYAGDARLSNLTTQGPITYNGGSAVHDSLYGCPVTESIWQNYQGPNSSPWVVAMQRVGLCSLSNATSAVFIILSILTADMRLYAASRTLHGMAVRGLISRAFVRCTKTGIPYVATLASATLGLLAYMNGAKSSIEIFRWFVHLATSATAIVWAVICVAFIRFYQGVKLRSDILSRRDESYPFRTPFQPYLAYFGAIMSSLIAVFLGVFLFLPDQWSTSQFFATYMSVFLFGLLYGMRKAITKSIIVPLDEIDFDTDRKAMENIGWAEDRVYHRGLIGSFKKYTSRMRQFIGTRWLAGFTN